MNAFVLVGEAPPLRQPSFLTTAQKAAATPMRANGRKLEVPFFTWMHKTSGIQVGMLQTRVRSLRSGPGPHACITYASSSGVLQDGVPASVAQSQAYSTTSTPGFSLRRPVGGGGDKNSWVVSKGAFRRRKGH